MEFKPVEKPSEVGVTHQHSSESTDDSSLLLFTNVEQGWALDSSESSLYSASIFYMKLSPQ